MRPVTPACGCGRHRHLAEFFANVGVCPVAGTVPLWYVGKHVSGLVISSLGLVPREEDRSGCGGHGDKHGGIVSISTSYQLGPSDPNACSSELAPAKVI